MSAGRSKAKHIIGEGPPTLHHWQKWREDAGVRGTKQLKATWGIDKRKRDLDYGGSGFAWAIEDQDGYKRWCSSCGDDILKGQQSVHTMSWRDDREEIDWEVGWHAGCVTPERWRQLLGQPMAGANQVRRAPITAKAIQGMLDTGSLKLQPLMQERYEQEGVSAVVEALKARR